VATKCLLANGNRMMPVAGILLVLALLATGAWAIDTPNERITLVDLTGVHVVFDEIGEAGSGKG